METMTAIVLSSILLISSLAIPTHSRSFYTTHDYIPPAKQKITKIRTYIHDTLSGTNPTAVQIARPNNTKKEDGPTPFGSLFAFDDPLTDGPELNSSNVIGNAKGTYLSASRDQKAFTLVLSVSLGFTTGKFNGSTVSVLSRNPVTEKTRELAIVGGTGKFRNAKGFVRVRTIKFDVPTGDAVLEYDVNVIHD